MPIKGNKTPLADRLRGKYTIDEITGCWNWNASLSSQGKYPTVASEEDGRTPLYVHHATWTTVNGPVPTTPCPDGSHRWELHHSCTNNKCINPSHIDLVTHREHVEAHKHERRERKDRLIQFAAGLLRVGRTPEYVKYTTGLPASTMTALTRLVLTPA